MKKLIVISLTILVVLAILDYLYYYSRIIYIPNNKVVTCFSKSENEKLYIADGNDFKEFQVKGVNLGLGKPGHYATDEAITKEEYLSWFKQIQDMGANVIRIYTLGPTDFYEAFYDYNIDNENPLYLIHGVWVDDYLINSIYSATDEIFYEPFIEDCEIVVDVIHGRYKVNNGKLFPQHYKYDISEWVYGYILGVEWESTLVTYTNLDSNKYEQYNGKYIYTDNASSFEVFLAKIGDSVIDYETKKYGKQRIIAFSNWCTTDPFQYNEKITTYFEKTAMVDVENIKPKKDFEAGFFASYHVYPYYPDYCSFLENHEVNTYLQYLKMLNEYHTIPVVITEFGLPSSRGGAAIEDSLGRNQGNMSEKEQGEALVSMYQDIVNSGSNGGIVFVWQDEWFKRTWNTMANVNLDSTAYWSDYQTNEQHFGLLSFDPGEEKSICYVDGNKSDWSEDDLVNDNNVTKLYMKYDEKFIYFMIVKKDFNINSDKLYIPIDTISTQGSKKADNMSINMSEAADFVIEINGENESRVWVQERYNTTNALFSNEVSGKDFFSMDFPEKSSSKFGGIELLLQKYSYFETVYLDKSNLESVKPITFNEFNTANPNHFNFIETYETGKLTYGNANPESVDFNSLADFCAGDGFVEIKIPWQLLNFADPTKMYIHDDYYENYGVEYVHIDSMNVGVGDGTSEIKMEKFKLTPIGKNPEYHERLKQSYYILKDYWTE